MLLDSLPESPPSVCYTRIFDYDVGGNLIYEGWARAQLNAPTSRPCWAIRATTYGAAGPLAQRWAGGDSKEQWIWDARATLSYA